MKKKLVLVGLGMAGARLIEHLQKEAPDQYDIRVFNKEPVGGYNRIMLSPVLAGETSIPKIMTHDFQWFEQRGIHLHTGTKITHINPNQKIVTTDLGQTYPYDELVIATGSRPFILPVPGSDLDGVVAFRDIRDVNTMIEMSKTHRKAVVIGGGLLGLEAANGLMKRGMEVTVVHLPDVLMEQQMDEEAGLLLQKSLEDQGMKFEMGAVTESIEGDEKVEGIRFKDGRTLPADLVVMAVGIRPNVELAKQTGLKVDRGIVVDDQLKTSVLDVYALGECVEHRGKLYGLVAPLYEMAEALAKNLAGKPAAYLGSVTSTMLKVTGIELFSAGDFKEGDKAERLVYRDLARSVYRKVLLKDGKIQGAVMYGDVTDAKWIYQLMLDKKDVTSCRETLVFGKGFQACELD
jgi:nitrite reductase (NADH) large subunit